MSSGAPERCSQSELVYDFAIGALRAGEAIPFSAHLALCAVCRAELAVLRPVVASFVGWPMDVLRPTPALWDQLSERITNGAAGSAPANPSHTPTRKFDWADVAPGIECKVLATDPVTNRVSMLVRLAPDTEYPPHRHAGVEELHLLHGELWINERKLYPGDYNRADAGTSDSRVWSETGCTCVLITSRLDELSGP